MPNPPKAVDPRDIPNLPSPSTTVTHLCQSSLKMRHKISKIVRNQHKPSGLENAQIT